MKSSQSGASAEEVEINYKDLLAGDSLNLYYNLLKNPIEFRRKWQHFSDAKDNFSHQLNSIVK